MTTLQSMVIYWKWYLLWLTLLALAVMWINEGNKNDRI